MEAPAHGAPVRGSQPGPGELVALLRGAHTTLTATSAPRPGTGDRAGWAQVLQASQHLINTATAMQDHAMTALAAIEPHLAEDGTQTETHRTPGHQALDAPAIIAGALTLGQVHATNRVTNALRLAADGPPGTTTTTGLGALHDAMRAGHLDPYRACVVADELDLAPPEVADAVVTTLTPHFATDTAVQLRRLTRRTLAALCPDLLRERATRARKECGLRRWAAEPGTDHWEGTFPSEDAIRAWAAVDALAQQLLANGTCERIDQARAQALIDLVTGNATIETTITLTIPADTTAPDPTDTPHTPNDNDDSDDGTDDPRSEEPARACPRDTDPAPTSPTPRGPAPAKPAGTTSARRTPAAAITTSAHDLVEVAHPRGGQPLLIPRSWLHALTTQGKPPTIRRCDPTSGALLDNTTHPGYRPPQHLAAVVRQRDGRCRFPGCHVAARFCDLDHTIAWPTGPTTAGNLICLCRRHHRIKQRPGWHVRLTPDGITHWTDPTGHTRTTHPINALHPITLPAHPATARPTSRGGTTDHQQPPPTDTFSALEFTLEHLTPTPPCRSRSRNSTPYVDRRHRPEPHHDPTTRLVYTHTQPPSHRRPHSRTNPWRDLPDDPPF